jgi:hypothetical protein
MMKMGGDGMGESKFLKQRIPDVRDLPLGLLRSDAEYIAVIRCRGTMLDYILAPVAAFSSEIGDEDWE